MGRKERTTGVTSIAAAKKIVGRKSAGEIPTQPIRTSDGGDRLGRGPRAVSTVIHILHFTFSKVVFRFVP